MKITWKDVGDFCKAHWILIADGAATVICWILGFSTLAIWPVVAGVAPLWLLGRIVWLRQHSCGPTSTPPVVNSLTA